MADWLDITAELIEDLEVEEVTQPDTNLVCIDVEPSSTAIELSAFNLTESKSDFVSPAVRYISSLGAKSSQNTTINILTNIAKLIGFESLQDCPWEKLNYDVVQFIIRSLQERELAPATINSYLNAIKQTMQHAFDDELIEVRTLSRIKSIKPIRGERVSKGRKIEAEEIRALLQSCAGSKSAGSIRDAAIICLMRGCGLRRAEVPALKVESVNKKTRVLTILGKGNKERVLQIPDQIFPILEKYMRIIEDQDWRGKEPKFLFMPVHKTGRLSNRRLADSSIRYILDQRIEKANIERFSPHDMRRTFATSHLEDNVEMSDVQKLMGHSDIRTTQKYDLRNQDRLFDISKEMSIF